MAPGSIPLEIVGNDFSRRILDGNCLTGDRSEALATALQEWYGWQSWAALNGIQISGDAKTLGYHAGAQLSIDLERVELILKTINPEECQPAALYLGGEESCWKKIPRSSRRMFEEKCPAEIKDAIASLCKSQRSSSGSNRFGNDCSNGSQFSSNASPQGNEWNAPVSRNREIGWFITQEVSKKEADPNTDETMLVPNKKGKSIREKISNFIRLCNFDFWIERELVSEDGNGLVLQIKRSIDNVSSQKRVIIKSIDYSEVTRFVDAVKIALGSGIVCNLKKENLGALLHTRLKDYRARGGRTYRLAERVGQQEDGVWVFVQYPKASTLPPTLDIVA